MRMPPVLIIQMAVTKRCDAQPKQNEAFSTDYHAYITLHLFFWFCFVRLLSLLHANHAHTTIIRQFIDSNAVILCALLFDVVKRSTL